MSDQSSFINTYLDSSIGMIHENINQILQLRTQAKLANDLVKQKDEIIANLQQEFEQTKTESNELQKKSSDYSRMQNEYNALRNKASHLDSITKQLSDTNRQLSESLEKISELNEVNSSQSEQITILTSTVKELEKKLRKYEPVVKQPVKNKKTKPQIQPEEIDDF